MYICSVSILFLNNQAKAKKLIDLLDQQTFHLQEADTVRALKGNPNYYRCKNKPKNYDKFARDFEKQGGYGCEKISDDTSGPAASYWLCRKSAKA